MGTTYTGLRVQDSYNAIIKIGDNGNLSGTAKLLSDALGNDSPLYLSTSKLGIGVSPSFQFQTSSNAKIGGNLTVAGNLTVNGTTTFVDSTIVEIGDNMIELAKDNTANTMDIGWYGTIVSSGEKYVGMKYDAGSGVTTPEFHVGLGTVEPGSTAEWTVKGKLVIGAIDSTGGTFSGQITIPETPTADGHAASKKYVDDHQNVEVAERVEITVKNKSGVSLSKGTIVHVSPSATPPSGNVIEVIKADYDDATKMPGIGVLNETIGIDNEGSAVMMGAVSGIDTSSFSAGDELYVGNDGAFTNTKPTATNQLVQKIAVVIKVHVSNGSIKVFGAGRSNDVPNKVDRTINFADNAQLRIGDDSDLRLVHDGTDSFINSNGTGDLYIQQFNNDKDIIFKNDNGSGGLETYFYLDGGGGITRFTNRLRVQDNINIEAGSSGDLKIYHDGSNSYIKDGGSGNLLITSDGASVQINKGTTENMAEFFTDGAVKLYYDSAKKFETTSSGVTVTGNTTTTGHYFADTHFRSTDTAAALSTTGAGIVYLRPNGYNSTTGQFTLDNSGNGTFAGTIKQTGKALTIEANDPEIVLKDTDEGADDKVFRIINVSEELRFTARTDSNGANADGGDVLKITRAGNATFAGAISAGDEINVNLSSEGKYFEGGSGNLRRLSITSGTNISAHALHTFNIASGNGKYEFDINGTTEFSLDSSSATFFGDVIVPEYIKHSGDLDTSIRFTTNKIRFYTANNEVLDLDSLQNAIFAGDIKQSTRITLHDNGTITWGAANDYGNLTWDTGYALVGGLSGKGLKLFTNGGSGVALTIDTSQNASFENKIGLNGATPEYTIDTSESTIGTLRMVGDTNHTFIRLGAGGGGNDVTLIRIDGSSSAYVGETDSSAYGFSLKYLGSLSGNENALALYADNSTAASQVESFRVKQDGTLHIQQGITINDDLIVDGIGQFAGAIRITETGTAQHILIGNQDSGGANKPGMIMGVNGHIRIGYGSDWTLGNEGGTFTSQLTFNATTAIFYNDVEVGTSSLSKKVRAYHSDGNYIDIHGYGVLFSRTSSYIRPVNDNTQNMYFGYDAGNLSWNNINFDFSNLVDFKYDSTKIFRIKNGGVEITGSNAYLTIHGSSQSGWNIYSPNDAFVHMDVRNLDSDSAMMHKYTRNSADNGYRAYYENWYDGSSYHRIGAVNDGFEMLGSLEVKRANAQLQLTDTDDSTFTEFSSSGNKLAIRQNSTTANHLWLSDNGDFGIGIQPANKLHIDSNYTNSVKIQGTGSYNLFSYHDSGGVGWATGSGTSYDTLIYMQGQSDRISFYTGQAKRCFINENGQWVIDSTTSIASASANAKLIVGGVMSTGSSAIIQANGFMRLRKYVIVHSDTTTSNAGLLRYTNDGYFYTTEGAGKNHFTIGSTSNSFLNGISGTQTTLKVASSNVACLLLHSTATNGVPWQNYSSSNGTLNWYNDSINMNALAISNFDGSTASSNSFNSTELRLHTGAKTGWGVGDILGQISFYNLDQSGVGDRDAVLLKATNLQGNGTSTTTFDGNLEIWTSAYNSSANKCATFTGINQFLCQGPIVAEGVNGTYSADVDTVSNAGFVMQQTHKFYSLSNSDRYLRNLIEHNSSNDIVIGQGGTSLIRDIHLICGSSGNIKFLTDGTNQFQMYSNGDFHADGDIVAYSTSISDAKLKDNVNTIENALDKVNNLRGVEYIWNYGSRKDQKDLGVIAQEVEQVLPEIVREKEMMDGDKYKTVDYEKLTAVLIESVKELSAEVKQLKKQINGSS